MIVIHCKVCAVKQDFNLEAHTLVEATLTGRLEVLRTAEIFDLVGFKSL